MKCFFCFEVYKEDELNFCSLSYNTSSENETNRMNLFMNLLRGHNPYHLLASAHFCDRCCRNHHLARYSTYKVDNLGNNAFYFLTC